MKLSQIVAGTMTWGEWGSDYTPQEMAGMIEHCLEQGITTFDHADIYGHYSTEAAFGAALEELGTRDPAQIQIVTKCGINMVTNRRPQHRVKSYDSSYQHIIDSVDRSLAALRVEYIDLLLLHRPDALMEPAEVARAFDELRQRGKVRQFGVSNYSPSQFELLATTCELVTNQVECNPLHADPFFDGTFDQCLQRKITPMIWSPLGGKKYFTEDGTDVLRLRETVRNIAEKYDGVGEDVILMAWLMRHPSRPIPVIGTTKKERIIQAKQALNIELERQDWYAILEAGRGHEVA